MLQRGGFWKVPGSVWQFYGTSQHWICQQLEAGHDILLEIDWQGAERCAACFPGVGIFILPPALDVAGTTVCATGQKDSDASIACGIGFCPRRESAMLMPLICHRQRADRRGRARSDRHRACSHG